jgi:hypothetical protein
MKLCWECGHKYPKWMYHKVPKNSFSRDGRRYSCRICNAKSGIRYKKGEKNAMGFARLERYNIRWWERFYK